MGKLIKSPPQEKKIKPGSRLHGLEKRIKRKIDRIPKPKGTTSTTNVEITKGKPRSLKGKLLKKGLGLAAGFAGREGLSHVDIPPEVDDAVLYASIAGAVPKKVRKLLTPSQLNNLVRKMAKKFLSPKRLAKKAALSAVAGPFAGPVALGSLGYDVWRGGEELKEATGTKDYSELGDLLCKSTKKKYGLKHGGQIKRKASRKPRGVGVALKGYGAVSK